MTDPLREDGQLEDVPLPEANPTLVGHDAVRAALRERLDARRLPGGILLHGPSGIGKATLAFDFARQVLAATGDESAERVAEQVAAGVHPNVFVLRRRPRDAKGFYSVVRVDDVRELRQDMRQTRGRAGHRICIVDPIDDLNVNAANALLKLLEEPPADTTFVLVSHRPGRLLPTIRSRCQAIALRPLEDSEMRTALSSLRPDAPSQEIERAAILGAGRVRKGLEALLLAGRDGLAALANWLEGPAGFAAGAHLALADTLAVANAAEAAFARDMLMNRLAGEARQAGLAGERMRLASATALWDNAGAAFSEADTYNLDTRQTYVTVFDAIRRHAQTHS